MAAVKLVCGQQGFVLVGLDQQVVALDRLDRADRRAARIGDLHADIHAGLGEAAPASQARERQRSLNNQSHLILVLTFDKEIITQPSLIVN